MTQSERRPRRSLRTLVIEPFRQIRFGLHVSAVSLIFAIVLMVVIVRAFYKQYQQVIEWFQVAEIAELMDNDVIVANVRIILIVMFFMVVAIHWVIFRRTHRLYGPMVAIQRFIQELQKGNFEARVVVREKDDFKHVVKQLNQLASKLEREYGKKASFKQTDSSEQKKTPSRMNFKKKG